MTTTQLPPAVLSLLGEQMVLRNNAQAKGNDAFAASLAPKKPTTLDPGVGPMTVEIWLRTFDAGTVMQWVTGTSTNGMRIDIDKNGVIGVYTGTSTTAKYQTQPTNIADGAWHQLRLVRKKWTTRGTIYRKVEIYLDGVLQTSATPSSLTSVSGVTKLVLGGRATGSGQYQPLRASFADVRVWKVAISEKQSTSWRYIRLPKTEWIDNDLRCYWDFAGGVLTDRSSYQQTGTLGAEASLVDMKFDDAPPSYALEVTGADLDRTGKTDGAEVTGTSNYAFGTGTFTIEGWIRTRSGGFMVRRSDATAGYALGIDSAGYLRFHLESSGVDDDIKTTAATGALDGAWHHLAATRDANNNLVVYLDGVPQSLSKTTSTADLSPATSATLRFASPGSLISAQDAQGAVPAARQRIAMRLDEVRLWSVARSADTIYNTMTRTIAPTSSLVGYWHFQTANILDTSQYQNTKLVSLSGRLRPNGDDTLIRPPVRSLQLGRRPRDNAGVTVPVSPSYGFGIGDFTIETWVKASKSAVGPILSTWDGSGGIFLYLHTDGSLELHPLSGKITASIDDGQWHQIAVTRKAVSSTQSVLSVYVDGVRIHHGQATSPTQITANAPALHLGHGASMPTGFAAQLANTFITEVRLWRVARSQSQIQDWRLHAPEEDEEDLVGYWSFERGAPIDRSPVGNSGALTGRGVQIIQVDGLAMNPPPSVLRLPGNGARVRCGTGLGFAGGAAYTLEAWIKPKSVSSGCILSKWDGKTNGKRQYWLGLQNGKLAFAGHGASVDHPTVTSVVDLEPNEWYHVAAVYSGSGGSPANKVRLFVNGSPASDAVSYTSATLTGDATPLLLGANANNTGFENSFNGSVRTVRIWSAARSASSLRSDLFKTPTGSETGLAATWDFALSETRDLVGGVTTSSRLGGAVFKADDLDDWRVNSAVLFDASSQYIDCGTASGVDFVHAFTAEMWVKPELGTSGKKILLAKGSSVELWLQIASGQATPYVQIAGLGSSVPATTKLPLGVWSHIAAVYDPSASTLSWVVDGKAAGSGSRTGTPSIGTDHLAIGADATAPSTNSFDGQIAEVRLWAGAVGAEEIALHKDARAIGNQTVPSSAAIPSAIELMGYWPLTQDAGQQELDLSAHRNNGTPKGGASHVYTDLRLSPPLPKIHAQSRLIQDWDTQDESGGQTDGHTAFRTVLKVTNPDGSLIGRRVRLRIWAPDPGTVKDASTAHKGSVTAAKTTLRIGGATYQVDASAAADVETDPAGEITVNVETHTSGSDVGETTLSCNPLKIWADFMPEDDRIVIAPDDHLHRTLAKVQGSDLQAGSSPLLPSSKFKSTDADAVADAIRGMAGTVSQGKTLHASRFLFLGATQAAVASGEYLHPDVQSQQWDVKTGGGAYGHKVETGTSYQAWELGLGKTVTYQNHTAQSFEARLLALGVTEKPMLFEEAMLFGSWGSFWNSIKKGVSNLTSVVVQGVKKGVRVVLKTAAETLNVIITKAKQVGQTVFGFVSSVLQKYLGIDLAAAAKKILDFFRTVFDWDDILATQQVIAGLLGQLESIANQTLDIAEQKAGEFLTELSNTLHTRIDDLITLLGTQSPDQITSSAPKTAASRHGVENGFMVEKIKNSAEATHDEAPLPAGTTDLHDLLQQFLDDCKTYLMDNAAAHQAFADALNFFGEIRKNPGSLFQLALSGLLKVVEAVGQLAIGAAQVLVRALIRLLRMLVRQLADIFAARIELPLLTWLFEKKLTNGQPLNLINLVSLAIAIPATVAYKAAHPSHAAPFSEADVKTYESLVFKVPKPATPVPELRAVEELMTLSPTTDGLALDVQEHQTGTKNPILENDRKAYVWAVLYSMNWAAFSVVDVWADVKSLKGDEVPRWTGNLLILFPVLGAIFGPPTGGPGFPEPPCKTTAYKLDWTLWGLKLFAPFADLLTTGFAETLGEQRARRVMSMPDYSFDEPASRAKVKRLFRNVGKVGPIATGAYGAVLLGLTIWMAVCEINGATDEDGNVDEAKKLDAQLKLTQNIGEAVPVFFKLLKVVPIEAEPEGPVLHGLVVVFDVLGDGMAFVLTVWRADRLKPVYLTDVDFVTKRTKEDAKTITPLSSLTLKPGEEKQLYVAGTLETTPVEYRDISEAKGLSVTSSGSQVKVLPVQDSSEKWQIRADPQGRVANLTATFVDADQRSTEKQLTVEILYSATLSSISVQAVNGAAAGLPKGESRTFRATGHYSDQSTADLTGAATWMSQSTSVASKVTGASSTFEAKATSGSSRISAAYGGQTGQKTLTVGTAALTKLELSPANPRVAKGATRQLSATGTYSDGTTSSSPAVTWTSEDTSVATVSSSGLVTAVAEGVAAIVATSGSIRARTLITVIPATFTQIVVTPDDIDPLYAGRTFPLTAQARTSDGDEIPVTEQATWSSSNTGAATIGSTGVVTAKSVSTDTKATITATFQSRTATARVMVVPAILDAIKVTGALGATSVAVSGMLRLTVTGTKTDAASATIVASRVSYASSDPSVATVDASGSVTGVTAGTVTVSAQVVTPAAGMLRDEIVLSVTAAP